MALKAQFACRTARNKRINPSWKGFYDRVGIDAAQIVPNWPQ